MKPDNYELYDGKIPLFGFNLFCPLNDFSAKTLNEVMLAIESSIVGINICWKLNLNIKQRLVDGFWSEVHEYKNISLEKDRLGFLEKLESKKALGGTTFWNGDLSNLVKISCELQYVYLPGINQITFSGYGIDFFIAKHLSNFNALFQKIAQISRAKYLVKDYSHTINSIESIEDSLAHDLDFDERYPGNHQSIQELAVYLPHLKDVRHMSNLKAVPRLLWLNYWDAETAKFYNFPDLELDARLMPLAEELPNGGWIFKLTEEPLDITRADHREAIIWAYQRFKPVGMTVEEFEKYYPPKPRTPTSTVEAFLAKAEASLNGLPSEERKQAEANLDNFKEVLNKLGKSNLKK